MPQSNQVTDSARRESYWSLALTSLRYRNFRLLWLGSVTEHMGEFMQAAAILWIVNEMTHSALMLTIVGSSRFIPMLFMPVVGGVVADRVNRRSLLMVSLLGAALLSIVLTLLVVAGVVALWHLIVISVLGGALTSFNHPARHSIVPNLVKREHLLNAISLDAISVQASRLIGMLIGGYLIGFFGVSPIFALRAFGCLLAIFWLLWARIPATPAITRTRSPLHNLTEGLHYLRSNTVILSLMVLYFVPWVTTNTMVTFMPVFAQDILRIGAIGYGYLQAAPGLGAIISLIVLTLLTYYKRKSVLLIGAGIIMGIGLISFSASLWLSLSLFLLVVIGGMQTIFMAVSTTLIQSYVPDELRGRVMSWRELTMGLGPTSSILFGAIAQYTGVPFSLGLLGGISLIIALSLIFFLPRFRSIE